MQHSRFALTAALALATAPASASSFKIIYQATALDGAVGYSSQLYTPLPVAGGGIIVETAGGGGGDQQIILLTPGAAGQPYTRSVIHDFSNACSTDGGNPAGELKADSHGDVWGLTNDDCGTPGGTLFKLTKPATTGGSWTYAVVLQMPASFATSFAGTGYSGTVFDAKGNLYGLLNIANANVGCASGCGLIYEIPASTLAGTTSTVETLATLPANIGYFNDLSRDSKGNLYTSQYAGGAATYGAVWQVSPPATAGGAWTASDIHDFCTVLDSYNNCVDGAGPTGAPAVGANGVLYGANDQGGPGTDGPAGLIWSLTPPASAGAPWTLAILHELFATTYVEHPVYTPLLTKSGKLATLVSGAGTLTPNSASGEIQGGLLLQPITGGNPTLLSNGFAAYGYRNGALTPDTRPVLDASGKIYGSTDNDYTKKTQARTPAVIYQITP